MSLGMAERRGLCSNCGDLMFILISRWNILAVQDCCSSQRMPTPAVYRYEWVWMVVLCVCVCIVVSLKRALCESACACNTYKRVNDAQSNLYPSASLAQFEDAACFFDVFKNTTCKITRFSDCSATLVVSVEGMLLVYLVHITNMHKIYIAFASNSMMMFCTHYVNTPLIMQWKLYKLCIDNPQMSHIPSISLLPLFTN